MSRGRSVVGIVMMNELAFRVSSGYVVLKECESGYG